MKRHLLLVTMLIFLACQAFAEDSWKQPAGWTNEWSVCKAEIDKYSCSFTSTEDTLAQCIVINAKKEHKISKDCKTILIKYFKHKKN